jgi:peptide/nickel transport system substrate-binding protein
MAPETVTAGPNDWRNQTGTGPYILSDYVDGGGATYTRNVNYWGTATISGKSYQLPFIDKVIYPVIPDQSTQIAALRTGKIDWDPLVKQTYTASLTQSSPALIQKQYLSGQMLSFRFNRIKSKYFSDKNLRRAMMIGTDLNSIAKLIYGGGEVVDYPLSSLVPGYTPLDQMPASQKELYTYDPVKAKALIAAAGYPAGFKVIISTGSDATSTDIANLCVSMWSQIGVTATIQILDSTAMATANNDVSFPDGLLNSGADVNPFVVFNDARNDLANPTYTKTEATDFTTPYYVAMGTVDPVQRTALIKDLNLKILDDVPKIPFTNAYALDCYWPWLKNYYGEVEASYYNQMPMVKIMWIDQNLKKSLGK